MNKNENRDYFCKQITKKQREYFTKLIPRNIIAQYLKEARHHSFGSMIINPAHCFIKAKTTISQGLIWFLSIISAHSEKGTTALSRTR